GEHVMGTKRMILGTVVLMALVGTARASPVTFEFAGEITSVEDLTGVLGGAVSVGSLFSGSYTFESTTGPTSPGGGFYADAITAVSGQVGDLDFLGPLEFNNFLLIADDVPESGSDQYLVRAAVELLGEITGFSMTFVDSTGTIFSSSALPLFPPPLELFDSSEFKLSASSETFILIGEVTALVPEPATLVLLSIGVSIIAKGRPLPNSEDADRVSQGETS
ncbi:MAG: hypothetical protein WBE26_03940, partial [Phycisphaerae bacterium]